MQALTKYINEMSDPRSGNAPRHNFCDLITISLLCAISGGETAVDMENFGKSKEEFLRQFLDLPHGIPCHDAYSRLFRMIKPDSFQAFFDKFRGDFSAAAKESPAIALDGKEMRRSFDKAAEQSNLSIVTAFAHGIKLSLGRSCCAGGVEGVITDMSGVFLDPGEKIECCTRTCTMFSSF